MILAGTGQLGCNLIPDTRSIPDYGGARISESVHLAMSKLVTSHLMLSYLIRNWQSGRQLKRRRYSGVQRTRRVTSGTMK